MTKVIVYQLEGGAAIVETTADEHQVQAALFALGFFVNENYIPPAAASSGQHMYFYAS
jgi:hypothetical protein